jgi:hypothetical protein
MSQEPCVCHEYFVYDGRNCIGHFIMDNEAGEAIAFGDDGTSLGKFPGFKAAAQAISCAYRLKTSAAEARRRLSEPAPFVSGLPEAFGWRPRSQPQPSPPRKEP